MKLKKLETLKEWDMSCEYQISGIAVLLLHDLTLMQNYTYQKVNYISLI